MQRVGRRTLLTVTLLLCTVASAGLAAADGTGATGDATVANATVTSPVGTDTTPAGTAGVVHREAAIRDGQRDSHDSITLTEEFRLTPDQPGRIDVRWQFRIPDGVSEVKTRVPPGATNVRTTRFTRSGDLYEWPGDTSTASITFTVPANETTERTGPEAADGRLKFVDTGDWALTRRPPVTTPGYTHPRGEDPGVTLRNTTAGEGVVGEALLYLGPHETVERSAHGQRFRLVVPESATLAADREQILESVTEASDRLRVGARDSRVLLIAAPTTVSWGVLGLQTGERDFYVRADQRLDTPDNTWLHEYVHTRQDIDSTDASEWFFEAAAEYYAAQLTLEQDRIDYQALREHMERGTWQRFSSVRLVDPTTWRRNGGDYLTGALVAGDLDRRIRVETNGSATFQDVFRRLNRQESVVRHADIVESIRSAGGDGVVDPARRFIETTDRPRVWSRQSYQDAFGALPARFRYDLPDSGTGGVRVRSQYRDAELGSRDLVPGETLVLDVTVENVGGSAGEYDLAVTVDESVVTNRTGRLDAGVSTTETVEHTFDQPGQYSIGTGEDSRTVRVRDPATPVVTGLSVDRGAISPDEQVRVTATVENPTDRPGERTLAISQNGSEITSQQVRLAPGESSEVTATVSLGADGAYRFEAGDRSVTVTVASAETTTPTPTGTEENTGTSGPGFGPVAALVALALVLSLLVRQRVQ